MELGSSADAINQHLKMPIGAVSYGANIHESSTSKKTIINNSTNTTASNISSLISNTNHSINNTNHSISNNITNNSTTASAMGTLSQVTESAVNGSSVQRSGSAGLISEQHNTNINNNSTNSNLTNNQTAAMFRGGISGKIKTISGSNAISSTNNSGLVKYKECMKNHAANMGGYAVDGCGEFMPSGEEGSIEALKCAACGCHRNFHRRETNGSAAGGMSLLALPSTVGPNPTSCSSGGSPISGGGGGGGGPNEEEVAYPSSYAHPHHHHHHPAAYAAGMNGPAAMASFLHHQYAGLQQHHHLMAAAAAASAHGAHGGPTPLAKLHGGHPLHHHHHHGGSVNMSSKRFRTKFTMEQREKMFEFSEKLGWRIQKHDEAAVQQFCAETGVKRHVLKVWMHNNKNTFGKKLIKLSETLNPLPEQSS